MASTTRVDGWMAGMARMITDSLSLESRPPIPREEKTLRESRKGRNLGCGRRKKNKIVDVLGTGGPGEGAVIGTYSQTSNTFDPHQIVTCSG